jgi:hypothetical protein
VAIKIFFPKIIVRKVRQYWNSFGITIKKSRLDISKIFEHFLLKEPEEKILPDKT